MCTAVSYNGKHHYFGRNLDVERSYGEGVIITPRSFPLSFSYQGTVEKHYAIIGIGTVIDGYPLYFDATNEKGLSMAGLNFPGNAFYYPYREGKTNIAPFEVIPYVLSHCASVEEAMELLSAGNVVDRPFRKDLPLTPLHWMISDRNGSIGMESTREGLKLHKNPFGVLTNNPHFDFHRENMNRYMGLHEWLEENTLSASIPLENSSLGFGAMGLPGDFSSISRFVRAVFVKEKSEKGESEQENVHQFFHILSSVAMPRGCVRMENGAYEYTRYSSCCNTDTQVYYYTTYYDSTLRKAALRSIDLQGKELKIYPISN